MLTYNSHIHHPKRAILVWDNNSSNDRDKKQVTFAFVPQLKTDKAIIEFADKIQPKGSRIKDMPMEVI
jgi:hypothetical protein